MKAGIIHPAVASLWTTSRGFRYLVMPEIGKSTLCCVSLPLETTSLVSKLTNSKLSYALTYSMP